MHIELKKLKKINPKITGLVILLTSLLISGGLAVQETIGEPTSDLGDGAQGGTGGD